MNIKEAMQQLNKAKEESRAAYKAYQEAKEAQEAARQKCRDEYKSFFTPEAPESYLNSEAHRNYEAAQEATAAARRKDNTATAIAKAAGENYMHVVANTLRAELIAHPEKFNKPTHFKKFAEEVKAITGDRTYIDNSLSCSFYIDFYDLEHGHNSIFICEKQNGVLIIDPEKLNNPYHESTLKEIKAEARKAEKDAEKLRKAAANLEKLSKETRAQYKTTIEQFLPYYSCGSFKDSNLF